MVFKKSFFRIGSTQDPPPFMAKTILDFHFDYLKASLRIVARCCYCHLFDIKWQATKVGLLNDFRLASSFGAMLVGSMLVVARGLLLR